MPFEIVRNDIVSMQVDAIVNAANPRPLIGYGVDSWIHKKAGKNLLDARKKIGDIPFGEASVTSAFDLKAKYVIHAVTPVWYDGKQNEDKLLASCYRRSLQLALEYGCESIAFPLLAAGNHGFPKALALQTAIRVISSFLLEHEMQIYLVVFDRSVFVLSEKLFHSVKSYIDDNFVEETYMEEYCLSEPDDEREAELRFLRETRRKNAVAGSSILRPIVRPESQEQECMKEIPVSYAPRRLDDLMNEVEESFSESLIRIIDQKGLKDPDVYKRANVDRKLFSKIKNNKDYRPGKVTCIAFAIALELNLDETKDLIGRAGYALTHSSKFDIIIEYFIREKNYDMFEINEVLFAFGQPLIGC